ncbi:MAG: 16S rRNA (cytosine(967)-C(5))-methyltransferase RsmB [Thiolinea sp.]
MNSRVVAMRVLLRVTYRGESLTDVLQHDSIAALPVRDQAWVRNLCFGSLRWHGRLGAILRQMLAKPLKKADKDIECLLRLGLYQLLYQRTPDHAAVNETVAAARKLKKPWAGGLINGVLRRFLREQEDVLARADEQETAQYSFPPWLAERLKAAWPDDWQDVMQESNQQAPMILRVNQQRLSTAAYQQKLLSKGINAEFMPDVDSALILEQAVPVSDLPGFVDGEVSVQDGAAQLAAGLLQCEAGQKVLDACAAPGGKTCHILERYQGLEVLALDSSAGRLKQVSENLRRLKLSAKLEADDAANIINWWDGVLFDRILLDAPCSATGVIRRHPDIKLLRKDKDIAQLQQQQQTLLRALWQTLRPGGLLLYATCSVLPEENNHQVQAFLHETPDAEHQEIKADWGRRLSVGRQILPGDGGMDGFYYALLKKAMQEN